MQRCPGVEDVVVSAVPDKLWGDALVALYCGSADVMKVRAWARSNLQGAFVPKHFLQAQTLPRNAMGKLLRAEVRNMLPSLLQDK